MSQPIFALVLIGSLLNGCFGLAVKSSGSLGTGNARSGTIEKAASTAISATKAIATVNPDSTVATSLTAPTVQGLSGASVIIAPGSLSIAAEIVVEQASDFGQTSLTSEMGLAADIQVASASPGMIIRPTEDVDLKKPLALAMPLPAGFGFRLADEGSKYAIFYKYFDPSSAQLVTGFKVVDGIKVTLGFDEASGRDVIHFEGYFGAYWATILSREVKPSEVPKAVTASEPIVNKANVSVIETKGIVKETDIVVKQAIAEIVWVKPSIKLDTAGRIVILSANVPQGRTVQNCKADLFENPNLPSGVSLDSSGTSVEYKVLKTGEHSLVGRFRCIDDQGRTAVTPWSETLLIPAAPSTPAPATGICNAAVAPGFGIKAYENGQLTPVLALNAGAGCKYSADLYMGDGDTKKFYIMKPDSSYVCGLPSHTLQEGSQVLTCEKATAANVGSNFMESISGNYTLTVDFSGSEAKPLLTLTKIPCSSGDLYLQFSSVINPSSFPIPTSGEKMTHIGACEFQTTFASSPIPADGAVSVRNLAGTLACGDTSAGGNTSPSAAGRQFKNTCGSGHRYFNIKAGESGVTGYVFNIRTGPSAQAHFENDSAANDFFSYEVKSLCPREIYVYSDLLGQTPRSENRAYRSGACRYEFAFAADDITPAKLAFKLGDFSKTKLCGAVDPNPGRQFSTVCGSAANGAIISGAILGQVYGLTINGTAANGDITNVEVTPKTPACGTGLYLANALPAPSLGINSAFIETAPCVFEKTWIPASANDGFFVQSGSPLKVCGSNGDPSRQPAIGGSAGEQQCRSSASEAQDLSLIKPLNAIAGTNYKITMDFRFDSFQARTKVEEITAANSCANSLFIAGTGVFPSAQQVVSRGACLYSIDVTYTGQSPNQFHLRNSLAGANCFPSVSSLGSTNRATVFNCTSGSGTALNVSFAMNHTYRLSFKRSLDLNTTSVVLQDLTANLGSFSLTNPSGNALPASAALATNPYLGTGNSIDFNNLYWEVGSDKKFLVKVNGSPASFCGLAAGAAQPPLGGTPVDLVCGFTAATLGSARVIDNGYNTGDRYFVDIIAPPSFESSTKIKVTRALGFSARPLLTFLEGTGVPNVLGATAQVAGVAEHGPSPGSATHSVTWRDSLGRLWLYGGETSSQFKNDLWLYTPSNAAWTLEDANFDVFDVDNNFNDKPGARNDSLAWFDATHNRLYMFGGFGIDLNGNPGELNDTWYYDITGEVWVFVGGGLTQSNGHSAGGPGDESTSFNPGGRRGAMIFTDGDDYYAFGGSKDGGSTLLNDLWRFNTNSNQWAFMSGSPGGNAGSSATQPSGRTAAAVWEHIPADPDAAYMYGGYNGLATSRELWRFDLNNRSWQRIKGNDSGPASAFAIANGIFHPVNEPGTFNDFVYGAMVSSKSELWLIENSRYWAYSLTLNQWALVMADEVGSPNLFNNLPTSIPSPGTVNSWPNYISGRLGARIWSGASDFYLFGGYDVQTATTSARNDLWRVVMPVSNVP